MGASNLLVYVVATSAISAGVGSVGFILMPVHNDLIAARTSALSVDLTPYHDSDLKKDKIIHYLPYIAAVQLLLIALVIYHHVHNIKKPKKEDSSRGLEAPSPDAPRGSLSFDEWWTALKADHVILGIHYYGTSSDSSGKSQQSFTLEERILFLVMAVGIAWPGVFLKYFYLPTWVPWLFNDTIDELNMFPEHWMVDIFDSALCGLIAGSVDTVLGRELVRTILKKDWESQGGVRRCASYTVCGYAALLSAGCFGHLCYTIAVSKPHLSFQLLAKYVGTVVMKMTVVETCMITAKTFLLKFKENRQKGDKKKDT